MISTTGSDGRYENKAHPWVRSNLELQIVTTVDHSSERVARVTERLRDLVGFTIENIEHKKFWIDTLSIYDGNPDLVFPTRFFDSVTLYDPENLRSKVLRGISDEIIREGRFWVRMYDRYRTHRKMMETGEERFRGKTQQAYDLDTGIFRYDPEGHIFGVKNGPLRYVQYMLAVALMRYIRDLWSHPGFLDELPTNIIDRLEFISDNALTSKNAQELHELGGIYAFFLHLYHDMQYRHFSEGETEFRVVDTDELRDIRDMLECLREAYKVEQFFPTSRKK